MLTFDREKAESGFVVLFSRYGLAYTKKANPVKDSLLVR